MNGSNYLDFLDYVWSFYGASDALYPIQNLKKEMICDAVEIYFQRLKNNSDSMTWGYGDSLDRERVRDIILEKYDLSFS